MNHNAVVQRETLVDFFLDLVAINGDFLVFDDGYRRRTHRYAEVGAAARGFAARLAANGLRKGDAVVFWAENRPEWIACYWGCVISGIVVVPIDYRSSADFVARIRGLVGARVVLVGDDVPADPTGLFGDAALWPLREFDWDADGPMPQAGLTRDDTTQIIFTSGATAEPKGVVIKHRNVLANLVPVEREVVKYRKYARPFHPLRFLNLLPLSHMFGQSMATSIPPMVRGTVIFTRSLNPHDLLRLMSTRRVSVLVCVPKILDVLREHTLRALPETATAAPPGTSIPGRWWRYRRVHRAFGPKFWAFIVGAAPLPSEVEEFWRRLGFAVIQGYGLTETAPIVTLNHPLKMNKGSVGTPIAGVEIRIAEDGEILVRGDNVTSGYFQPGSAPGAPGVASAAVDAEGWLHTGDIGDRDAQGRLFIKGRKKEMIVTPDGLNVFPEDVERVIDTIDGVRESAVVGITDGGQEHVHAVLVTDPGVAVEQVIGAANARLQDHQRIRAASLWTSGPLPRTEGTKKLKRAAIREWVRAGGRPADGGQDAGLEALIARFAHGRATTDTTTLEDLGLSSLERVELMIAIEDRFQTRIDEGRFTDTSNLADLRKLVEAGPRTVEVDEPVDFPSWNRSRPARLVRRLSLATWILPLGRLFAHLSVEGLEHLQELSGPVVFAANHQSHLDVPMILAALPGRWRARVAPAMAKEFFKAHFFPAKFTWRERLTNSVNYYLAALYFNAFPLPQREAGTRQTLSYVGELLGDGWSVLIFPEGERSTTGDVKAFRGGIGMIGSKLEVPIVPVRIRGLDRVLAPSARMATPGPARIVFGAPIRVSGDDYAALAKQVEDHVRAL
jgi:long-chain acyl-CoA synthetase